MNQLFVLDAGRADCIVITLATSAEPVVIVIDGGTKQYNGKGMLADFLDAHGIDRIDLLILTHLHQDHFSGFYNLINKVRVAKAIVPSGDIVFNERVYPYFGDAEYFGEYHEIFSYFTGCGMEVIDIYRNARPVLEFGEHQLRCLYPLSGAGMVIPECIAKLCAASLSDSEMKHCCDVFKENCNRESSIWALENRGDCIALFAGDSTLETMEAAFRAYGKRPRMLKLSHHGIGEEYFNREQLEMIRPKEVVVCNAEEYAEAIRADCEKACQSISAKIYYTFQGDYEMRF